MKTRTLPRLTARLRPEWPRLGLVTLFILISIGFSVAGPLILARATNLLFDGIIGKYLPVGATKAQAIAELRQRGEGDLADIFAVMHITPGAGVNLTELGQILGLAAVVYLLAAVAGWAQAYIMAGVAQRIIYQLRQEAEENLCSA
jgi:ATP-binding cassette subfamily B multidrug efflux pump